MSNGWEINHNSLCAWKGYDLLRMFAVEGNKKHKPEDIMRTLFHVNEQCPELRLREVVSHYNNYFEEHDPHRKVEPILYHREDERQKSMANQVWIFHREEVRKTLLSSIFDLEGKIHKANR